MTPATSSTASERQLDANRANAALSTGPRTAAGKTASSANAISHGLTATQSVLPGESETDYRHFIAEHIRIFQNANDDDLATQLGDLRWRLRRIPAFEAKVLDYEMQSLLNNPEFADLTAGLTRNQLEGLAYIRLVERRVLPNLYAQEARLNRRIDKTLQQLTANPPQPQPQPQTQAHPHTETENRKNEPNSAPMPPQQPHQHQAQSTKIGRNQPCPCGSNLKFKRCCGNPLAAAAA